MLIFRILILICCWLCRLGYSSASRKSGSGITRVDKWTIEIHEPWCMYR